MTEPDVPAAADGNRNRAHPQVRFAPEQHEIDLRAVARELAAEPASRGGRRQRALYRHGRLTVALFTFDAGGGLPDHVAAGVVTINVLDGRLRIAAGAEEHDLPAGKLLVLAPACATTSPPLKHRPCCSRFTWTTRPQAAGRSSNTRHRASETPPWPPDPLTS